MILVVGNINFDILFPLDRLPGPHEKITCRGATMGFGGSAANTAHWLAGLRTPVTLAGAVGKDPAGDEHLSKLRARGVDTRGVVRVPGTSGIAVIFSVDREKRMVRDPGANLKGTVLPELLGTREGGKDGPCQLVYLSGADTGTLAGYARLAMERGIAVICGWHGATVPEVAVHADGFILNADEVRRITGLEDPLEGIRALDSRVAAVTLTTGGCLVSEGVEVRHVPSPELEPVDRTGGGDAFAAGFLAGMFRNLPLEECGRLGNKLAARVIMEVGARPEIPIEDLELKMKD